MRRFQLVTEWRLDAPLARVWEAISDAGAWPQWWPSVAESTLLRAGDASGIGAVRRLRWKTALPYDLTFDAETVRIDPMMRIEARAFGELEGLGVWTFQSEGAQTIARYDWRVDVAKPWMRVAAPLLEPVFAWNHGVVMRRGGEGLARWLALHDQSNGRTQ
jgi:hypothetical protein